MKHSSPTLLLSLLTLTSTGTAQTDWSLLGLGVRPPMRAWMGMAYDFNRDVTVLTGGFDNASGNALGDTWEFDGTIWTQITAPNSPARDCMDLAFAISTARTVVFGGLDNNFNLLGDTWEDDGVDWTQTATTGPSQRVYMTLAYDLARDRVVGFGGGDGTSFADTWEYDPTTRVWTQASPQTTPPSREGQGMVYDFARNLIVMFGGWDSATNAIRSDTWEYDGVDWAQIVTPAAPTPRTCFGMVYDALRNRTILHGGADVNFTVNFNDTWEYDGTTWTQLAPITNGPGRAGLAMVHDFFSARSYVYGGEDAPTGNDFDETWELFTVNPATAQTFGAGCPGSAGVPALSVSTPPWISTTVDLQLTNLPAAPAIAVFALGFSNTTWLGLPLPLPLGPLGIPNCDLLASVGATATVVHGGGSANSPLVIPNNTGLAGVAVFAQALSLDAAAPNGFGAMSNGLTLILGSL